MFHYVEINMDRLKKSLWRVIIYCDIVKEIFESVINTFSTIFRYEKLKEN